MRETRGNSINKKRKNYIPQMNLGIKNERVHTSRCLGGPLMTFLCIAYTSTRYKEVTHDEKWVYHFCPSWGFLITFLVIRDFMTWKQMEEHHSPPASLVCGQWECPSPLHKKKGTVIVISTEILLTPTVVLKEMVIDHHRSLIDYPYLVLWTVETEIRMQGISSIGKRAKDPVWETVCRRLYWGIGNWSRKWQSHSRGDSYILPSLGGWNFRNRLPGDGKLEAAMDTDLAETVMKPIMVNISGSTSFFPMLFFLCFLSRVSHACIFATVFLLHIL